jgi:hypothetical protein
MKKLFLKDGAYVEAKATEDETGKYLSVYEDGKFQYSVFSGKMATRQMVLFGDGITECFQWEIRIIAELVENFNQYFNQMSQ